MVRSRNIKPGFYKNEELASMEPLARLLFSGLWCYADKEGRFEWRPARIKVEILPYDDCEIDSLLLLLKVKGFIARYLTEGKICGQVLQFKVHQNPHPHEAKSILPEFTEQNQCHCMSLQCTCSPCNVTENNCNVMLIPSSLIPSSLIPSSLIPDSTALAPSPARQDSEPSRPTRKVRVSDMPKIEPEEGPDDFHDRYMAWARRKADNLLEKEQENMEAAYPGVDLLSETNAAMIWLRANPQKRKSNVNAFLTNWLKKAQQKGGSFQGNLETEADRYRREHGLIRQ